jgi:hypothetical protein
LHPKTKDLKTLFSHPENICRNDYFIYRVDYDKGHWLHTIRTYDENELPKDIRHLVKSSYHDYNIYLVLEIEKPRDTFTYIVHLEGKTEWINVRVSSGVMDEFQKFQKSE